MTYYGQDNRGVHRPFNFQLIQAPWRAEVIAELIDSYEAALPEGGWPNWVPAVLAMRYDWHQSATVFIHNLSHERIECAVDVTVDDEPGRTMVCLQIDQRSRPNGDGLHQLILKPYGFHWYRLGGLDSPARHSRKGEAA